jgi:hypothetical protein
MATRVVDIAPRLPQSVYFPFHTRHCCNESESCVALTIFRYDDADDNRFYFTPILLVDPRTNIIVQPHV